ncbi:ABC transporter ATP-binding protein [Streptomyces sp. NPDC021225]|uniref:ABC transporter ATP-binding protein n=1 Tax=Streptomyces sp. NPDC021225 TaxID=3365121 RepID=UPI00379721D7
MSIALSLRGYGRTFTTPAGALRAVDGVDLDIAPGEFTALVGPSGCGKSTILRAVAGLDTRGEGEVSAGGEPVTGPHASRGLVFQEHRLFPWQSVAKNIGAGLRGDRAARERRVAELVELVGLEGFADAYPGQLSGGMAQRVAIARALAPSPDVLLLDEPFGALDAFTRIRLQDALHDIWAAHHVTAVLVTHDIDEAVALAQRVVVLDPRPGRVRRVHEIDLPYPRDRASARFAEHRSALLGDFALSGLSRPPDFLNSDSPRPESPRTESPRTDPSEEKHHA